MSANDGVFLDETILVFLFEFEASDIPTARNRCRPRHVYGVFFFRFLPFGLRPFWLGTKRDYVDAIYLWKICVTAMQLSRVRVYTSVCLWWWGGSNKLHGYITFCTTVIFEYKRTFNGVFKCAREKNLIFVYVIETLCMCIQAMYK